MGVQVDEDWVKWRAALTVEHEVLKEGVANFRSFQARGNSFFDSAEAVWRSDKERRKRNLAILAILAIPLTAAGCWVTGRIVHAVETIMHIEQEWQQAHPSEFVKPQSFFIAPDDPAYAETDTNELAY